MKLTFFYVFMLLTLLYNVSLANESNQTFDLSFDSSNTIDTLTLNNSIFPLNTFRQLDSISKSFLANPLNIDNSLFINDSIYVKRKIGILRLMNIILT